MLESDAEGRVACGSFLVGAAIRRCRSSLGISRQGLPFIFRGLRVRWPSWRLRSSDRNADRDRLRLGALLASSRGARIGLKIRAAADSRAASHAVGISVRFVNALAWGVSAAIGSIAGALIAPVIYLEPNMMLSAVLSAFASALLGALTNPVGAVPGRFAVAIVENLVRHIRAGRGSKSVIRFWSSW
ncbi:ABC transporter permease subunit [Bradyrhizobium sp. RDM12]